MSHRESTTTIIVLNLLACLLAAVAPASADGVSPGAPDHIAAVDQRCPTFIWELVEHTLYYEVVAYVLPEYLSDEAVFEASLEGAEEVLYTRVPGGAAGWTPPADRALAPGGRYVWFVRAVYEDGDGEGVKAGEWSRGHFFRVAEGPSAAELASALANLERASAGSGAQPPPPAIAAGSASASPKASGTGTASVPTAPAAIRGEHPEPSAEVYGVVGTAASPVGAGVAAVNTGGGADLVLDGSADLETDARLSQSGIDRPAATPETFSIGNSGGGGMTLEVAGEVSADSFAGDGSALTGIIASDADTLDGEHGAFYRDAGNLNAGTVPTGRYSAAADLAAEGHLGDAAGDLAQNNGVLQPTLNADLLDGADGAFFLDAGNLGTGTLSTSRYSAHADLAAEGYLDLSADGDLLTRAQGDDRFVDSTGDTVTGTLMVDGDSKRLASRATPNDETTTNVTKLEVRASDGTPLFSVDSEGDLSAASLTGDGAGLTGVTADDADTVDGYDAADLLPLTEPQVEGFITNGPINLAAASSMAGVVLSTGPHTVDTDTNAGTLCSPGEYLDGDGTCHTYSTSGGDAATLDGLDSTQFLRSDVNDEAAGSLTFQQPIGIGTSPDPGTGLGVLLADDSPGLLYGAQIQTTTEGASTDLLGIDVLASGPTASDGGRVAIRARVEGGSDEHIAIEALAVDTASGGNRIAIMGSASSTSDSGSSATGVVGNAHGTGVNYGVKANVSGGTENWGFYTDGDSYVGDTLEIGHNLQIGTGSSTDDDILAFDNAARLTWTGSEFQLSHALRVASDLVVDQDFARLVSRATAADVAAGRVKKLEVQDPAGASLFYADSDGTVRAQLFIGSGAELVDVRADDLVCSSCVGASDLASNSVYAAEIATGAVGSDEIATNAVGNDEIADGAVTTFKIHAGTITAGRLAPNAVISAKIEDGTIQAVDVDPAGGLYASKTSTYVATTQRSLSPGYCVEVIAICADANDLPLSGACNTPPATPIAITRTYLRNWSTTSSPASYLCDVCNNHYSTVTMEAQLACVSVPGS